MPKIVDVCIFLAFLAFVKAQEQPNSPLYDKHFNCITNCSSPKSLPKSCAEAAGLRPSQDNVLLLSVPNTDLKPFYVYCEHETYNSKAWTIIQRRADGSVNFNRNWLDYKNGFGDLYGEYWLGLDRIHAMTKSQPHELWILVKSYEGTIVFANYLNFTIASEKEGYKLSLDGHSGWAGDYLMHHNNMKFSTFDKYNDVHFKNCARDINGGWWFKSCALCNLNGAYYSISNRKTPGGIKYYFANDSPQYAHMAIRPL